VQLEKEAERQKQTDALKRQFADKANALAKWMTETRQKMTEEAPTLEEHLAVVRAKHEEVVNKTPEVWRLGATTGGTAEMAAHRPILIRTPRCYDHSRSRPSRTSTPIWRPPVSLRTSTPSTQPRRSLRCTTPCSRCGSINTAVGCALDVHVSDLYASPLFDGRACVAREQLGKRNEFNLVQQINAKNSSGVSEAELRDWNETFDHFDRDHNQVLDYVEFKSCLRGVGTAA